MNSELKQRRFDVFEKLDIDLCTGFTGFEP